MKRSEFFEVIKVIADAGDDSDGPRQEDQIAREGLRDAGFTFSDEGQNPIVQGVIYARHCGSRLNVYSAFDLIIALEKAWEYAQENPSLLPNIE